MTSISIAGDSHSHGDDNNGHKMHHHKKVEVKAGKIPAVNVTVEKDAMSGWNLSLKLTNFKFAPHNVNKAVNHNEGHAHIYVNGKKIARLYAKHYHISELPKGMVKIKVTLNANNHGEFAHNGKVISHTVKVHNH